jgi:NADH:ubiquinone oxidoreductase subunit 6 (subunit J)
MTFLHNCIQPNAVMMLFVFLVCLLGYGYPGYQGRATSGFVWLFWLACGVLALVAWILLVIS